ncbi:MAG: cytochrome c biogenesis CcdA family protein [Acidimicrobiia bacterium]
MIDAPLALAFASGMVATVNPCGFPLLPAYLSYFLGSDVPDGSTRAGVGRSLAVGGSVAAGFLGVFALAGLASAHLSAQVERWAPWLTIPIGLVLVVVGVAMARGFELSLSLPKLQRGGDSRSGRSMFLFGTSYAVASLSCTLPVFMGVVATTFRRENLASSLLTFVAFGTGMALVLLALTVSMGLARRSLVTALRRALPYVNRAAGVLLVLAGAYIAYYGWYELRVQRGGHSGSGLVDLVTGWSDAVSRWVVDDVGALRLGWLLATLLTAAIVGTYGVRARRR